MKTNITLITAGVVLALSATSAQAGVKDWLKDKKDKLSGQPVPTQVAEATPAEFAECKYFLKDQKDGKVPLTAENGKKFDRCNAVVNSDAKTLGTVEVKGEAPPKGRVDGRRLGKEAVKGCAMGAVMGLLGGGLDLRACAAGALATGIQSYQQQVKEARSVEDAATAAGMKATVKTETTVVKGKEVEKLQGVVVEYQREEMDAQGEKVRKLIDTMASLTTKAKNTLTITFEGSAQTCRIPLDALKARGVLDRHTVVDLCGKSASHRITITPVPDVD